MRYLRHLRRALLPALLLAPLCALPAAAGEARVDVRVLPAAEVAGPEFVVGEVAELDGADAAQVSRVAAVSLGRSPLPGRTLRLSESYVRARLAQEVEAQHVALSVPAGAEVTRASQMISGEDIGARVLAYAAEQAAAAGVEVEQKLATPVSDAVLPLGSVTWDVGPLGQHLAPGGARTYRVVARMLGEEVWHTLVRIDQKVFRDVVIAARPIRRNEIIRPQDVVLERRSIVGVKKADYLGRTADAVGTRAKRPIGRGEWLHKDLLTAVEDVPEGGPVVLVYATEQVRFVTPGVALVPAKVGEYIPVRNLQSGKIVYGVVQADESVKVN